MCSIFNNSLAGVVNKALLSISSARAHSSPPSSRHAWEYGQRIERQSRQCKHALDLFGTELQSLRKKLRDKCLQVILSGSSYCSKAEELLWKKSAYEVVQKCKAISEATDGASSLCMSYRNHLDMCLDYYCRVLESLRERTGVESDQTTAATDFKSTGLEWLKNVYYQCFIHLGDLARYQVSVGGSHMTAVAYYHRAIALDPTKGVSYNQLAALAGNRNEQLDAAYYYQRSVTSAQPFSGSRVNLARIYEKNLARLETLEKKLETTTEQDVGDFTRDLFLARFLRLQQMLQPTEGSASSSINERELERLCTAVSNTLEDCLGHDLSSLADTAAQRVLATLRPDLCNSSNNQEQPTVLDSIPHDLMLKICALAILASFSLRSLGSTFTPTATAFALRIFSQLLHFSHKRLSLLLRTAVATATFVDQPPSIIEQLVKQGEGLVEILRQSKFDVSLLTSANVAPVKQVTEKASGISKQKMADPNPNTHDKKRAEKKRHIRQAITRRRRPRRRGGSCESSEEEGEGSVSSSDSESAVSEDTLSDNLGEDDLEMLDKLSDCSSSEGEENFSSPEKTPPKSNQPSASFIEPPASMQKKSKRQIILAANFSNAPSTKIEPKIETKPIIGVSPVAMASNDVGTAMVDDSLRYLVEKTGQQCIIHSACSLVAMVSYLMPLRVFMEWVQSYPISVATTSQASTEIWSRLALFLNFLPNEQQLSFLDDSDAQFVECALLEDEVLRGFAPLISYQESLLFKTRRSEHTNIKQAVQRVRYFSTFGHFVADLRTAPSFSWDSLGNKFIGPAQKQYMNEKRAEEKELEQEKEAQIQRSKLMNAMAQQKLQHEVASLEVSAKKQEVFFTPYLVPDAVSLSTGLHLVKKLLASEKFIFVIAKSTIEVLDGMKKGRDNFAAREVIKFLERELKDGSKFIRAQQPNETLSPNAKKPAKMELDTWYLDRLIDCAVYYNQSFNESGQSKAVVTALLGKKLLRTVTDPAGGPEDSDQLYHVISNAWQHGVELDSVINFHSKWCKRDSAKRI